MKKKVAVLFTMPNSIYNSFPQCDCYDEKRNALTYSGQLPIIAHPPCRLWSRMKGLSTAPQSEKELARWAVKQIREKGGVLEHPAYSDLWKEMDLPKGQMIDQFGGWTLFINQYWFGHKAEKKTWLYIVGCKPSEIPNYSIDYSTPQYTVSNCTRTKIKKKNVTHYERKATPVKLAQWLIDLSQIIANNRKPGSK